MANLDKDYYLDKPGVQTLISELETNTLADEYSSSATYAVGDYCIHNNKIYRCTTAISTAESWTDAHWTLVIVGDELKTKKSGTVTSVTIKGTSPIVSSSSSAITTSGTRTISHADSGVTAGTYKSVTVNATGHVTAGSNPTTLSGYGITDAKIESGTITLGSNTITPLTSHQSVTDGNPTLDWGTQSTVATIGSTDIHVTMPANPNTDTKVRQTLLSSNYNLPLLMSYAQTSSETTNIDNVTYRNNSIFANASTGRITSKNLTVGISADNATFPNGGIRCYDVRNVSGVPTTEGVNFIMTNEGTAISSSWYSGLYVKSSGGEYGAWELIGPAYQSDNTTKPFYVRASNKTTAWGDWRKIYDSANPPSATDIGLGNVANIDQSKAIKSITRSGTTFTYTCLDDSTGTFTQQDNDTKNTTGADNTTSKIFLVGTTSQTSSNGSARTYSNVNCYASGGKLYSNGSEVLTSHQSVTDGNPTLSWSTQSTVATIGSTDIHVIMPTNPNTDTKVTAVGNHYTPSGGSAKTPTGDTDTDITNLASGSGSQVISGVTIDAAGHITGLTSKKIRSVNTTYTFANGTNGFTVTPSGGTAQTVTVTPSITNNITGSGTSGYLTKFNGTNTITNGPKLGSSTSTYLNNSGAWSTPPDTKNTAGSTNTTSTIYLIGATEQSDNPQTYSNSQVTVTNGTLQTNISYAVGGVWINSGGSGTSGGLGLWSSSSTIDNYGIAMRTTASKSAHGYVQGDYATFFSMNSSTSAASQKRGWIFRHNKTPINVASIGLDGDAVFNGSVTIGGNEANTSGCRLTYNSTTQSCDFVFA